MAPVDTYISVYASEGEVSFRDDIYDRDDRLRALAARHARHR
jgi:murein L,D-transpeptidase YcbB/YkuD